MKKALLFTSLFCLIVGGLWLSRSQTEEEKITQLIHQVREGIEQEKLSTVMDGFSEAYSDDSGFSHDAIKGLLLRQFLKNDPVTIRLSPMTVVVEETQARVTFEAVVFEGENVSIFAIPHESDVMEVTVDVEQQDGDWLIVSHQRRFTTTSQQ